MTLKLYAHPFSSYCQKVLIALYENGIAVRIPHARRTRRALAELAALWPLKRFPLLVDGEPHRHRGEHHHRVSRPASSGPGAAAARRSAAPRSRCAAWTASSTTTSSTPQQKIVFDACAPEARATRDGVAEARAMLDTAYGWLDKAMADRDLGGRRQLQPRRLRAPRRSCSTPTGRIAIGAGVSARARLPPAPAGAAVVRPRGR